MNKISGVKVARLLQAMPGMLRSLASERDEALEKIASLEGELDRYRRHERVEKVAQAAHGRNVFALGRTVEEKVASINEAVEAGTPLETLESAVHLLGPDGSLGDLEERGGTGRGGDGPSAISGNALESYILG